MRHALLTTSALLLLTAMGRADVSSGPKPGESVEEFKAFGIGEEKEVSPVADRKDKPTVFVFVQHEHFDRPMARFLKALDTDSKKANDSLKITAVWLTDKSDAVKEHLPRVNDSLKFANTNLNVFDGKNGPNGWSLNSDAHLTVVVVEKGKVTASFAYLSVNETDLPKVNEVLKKLK